jgi:hypothetical protein
MGQASQTAFSATTYFDKTSCWQHHVNASFWFYLFFEAVAIAKFKDVCLCSTNNKLSSLAYHSFTSQSCSWPWLHQPPRCWMSGIGVLQRPRSAARPIFLEFDAVDFSTL